METQDTEINLEKMSAPSYRLLVTAPMAAIMLSGEESSKWSDLLESVSPVYASAAEDAHGEVKEALLTASFMIEGGDVLIKKYFSNDSLSLERMMELSATGADIWVCKLSDGEVERSELIKLFKAIQAGLIEAVGDLRDENEMIDQLIQTQNKVIEHISSLN
ncbi:hypothetical protein [Thiohalophilus sp.]|uniref:hypothetical protein n=1 Tax=Thiohalophilus sp. TaxID=3028392 RepID=UPI002ACEC262|nr:hypothetical protein [Thiohalophilus sp.]MDZ7662477.1 hypothetical protein [Thiohalophilus sp.]